MKLSPKDTPTKAIFKALLSPSYLKGLIKTYTLMTEKSPEDSFDQNKTQSTIFLVHSFGVTPKVMKIVGEFFKDRFNIVYAPCHISEEDSVVAPENQKPDFNKCNIITHLNFNHCDFIVGKKVEDFLNSLEF